MKPHRLSHGYGTADESLVMDLEGREVLVSWHRVYCWSYDAHYGADADGNRGVERWEYDDAEPENVIVEDAETEQPITLTRDQQWMVDDAIDAYQKQHEPTGCDYGEEDADAAYEAYCERCERIGGGY